MRHGYHLEPTGRPARQPVRIERDIATGDRLRDRRDRLGPWASASPADRFVPQPPPIIRETLTEEVDTPFGSHERIITRDTLPARGATPPPPLTGEDAQWASPTPPRSASPPISPPPSPPLGTNLAEAEAEALWNEAQTLAPPSSGIVEVEDDIEGAEGRVPQFSRRRLLNQPRRAPQVGTRALAQPSGAATEHGSSPSAQEPALTTLPLAEYATHLFEQVRDAATAASLDAWRQQLLPLVGAANELPEPVLRPQAATSAHATALAWNVTTACDDEAAQLLRTHTQALSPSIERVASAYGLAYADAPLHLVVVSRAEWRGLIRADSSALAESRVHPEGRDARPWAHRLLGRFAAWLTRWLSSLSEALVYMPTRNQLTALSPNIVRRKPSEQRMALLSAAWANLIDRTFPALAEARHALGERAQLGFAHDTRARAALTLLTAALVDVLCERSLDAGENKPARPAWHEAAAEKAKHTDRADGALPTRQQLRAALEPLSRNELRLRLASAPSATNFVYTLR